MHDDTVDKKRYPAEISAVGTIAIQIDRNAVYDDDILFALLGVSARTLSKARQAKQLRFTRKGQRVLYLGQWVIEWLTADSSPSDGKEATDAR